ncbi:MAG: replication protein A [Candidatus Thermoplasmatota archaeon]|jgi:replication factor A1|nr:replication protein A [Candidatus Thermoplasmatota archaeon]
MANTKIRDLEKDSKDVSIKGKILSVDKKDIKNERGESVYYYGLIGDETGTIPFTAWAFPNTVRAGDVVEIKFCSVREYNEKLRLNIDSRTEVILKTEEAIDVKRNYREYKIRSLNLSDPFVSIEGRIGQVNERKYQKDGEERLLYSTTVEDDTGQIQMTSFGQKLEEGKVVRIEGARVSEYNSRLRISIGDRTKVDESTAVIGERKISNIEDINSPVGGIRIAAFSVNFGEKSGIMNRCSECRKRIDDMRCPDHPSAPQILDIFSYFTLDDGTSYVQSTAGREALLPLIGMKDEDLSVDNVNLNRKDVYRKLREAILGKAFLAMGDFRNGQNGLSFRLRSMEYLSEATISELSRQMEAEFA